ncbi:MAG TPA: DUF2752 domain-containing protein [Polyangia bacterium]
MAATDASAGVAPDREQRRPVSQILLGRFTRVYALIALVLAFVLPATGLGVPLCYFRTLFHLPCPGCGLSRSFASIAHLRLGDAVSYHPFGVIAFALLLAVVAVSVLPRRLQAAVAAWLDARENTVRRTYHVAVAAFLLFGIGRLAVSGLANGWPNLNG